MNIQLQLNVPSNGWDYFPLPNLGRSPNSPDYELIFQIPLPSIPAFVASWLGIDQSEPEFVTQARSLIEAGGFSLCEEGVGGTYFVHNTDNSIYAVFKPEDEEPGAQNNPKGKVTKPLLPPGGGALREVAAYVLDRGFSGVPETQYMSNVKHERFGGNNDTEKKGSLQRFVINDGVSSDVGSALFRTEDVHRIGVLDVRLFNLDRNGENMLITKIESLPGERRMYRLVPIDHAYCLPSVDSLDGAFFEWHYWPQSKEPFSAETLEYIQSINIEEDVKRLREIGISEDCIGTMVVCTLLLKRAAEAGLNLRDIASLMTREGLKGKSKLEMLIADAEKESTSAQTPFTDEFEKLLPRLFT